MHSVPKHKLNISNTTDRLFQLVDRAAQRTAQLESDGVVLTASTDPPPTAKEEYNKTGKVLATFSLINDLWPLKRWPQFHRVNSPINDTISLLGLLTRFRGIVSVSDPFRVDTLRKYIYDRVAFLVISLVFFTKINMPVYSIHIENSKQSMSWKSQSTGIQMNKCPKVMSMFS